MNGSQRVLVFRLGIACVAGLAYAVLFFASSRPVVANAAWALLSLLVFEKRVRGSEKADERDREILRGATIAGYSVFWVCFVVGCVVPAVAAPTKAVPLAILGWFPFVGWWLLEVVRASSGLISYRRGA